MNVDEAKKRGPERHLTSDYNFLGPGTFFKARMKGSDFYEKLMKDSGRKAVGTKPYGKPFNKLDACAKIHDTTYADPNASAAEVLASDKAIQVCAKKNVGTDSTLSEKLLSKVVRAGFEGKNALEAKDVLRKGSFADGGEKHGIGEFGKKVKSLHTLGMKALGIGKRGKKK